MIYSQSHTHSLSFLIIGHTTFTLVLYIGTCGGYFCTINQKYQHYEKEFAYSNEYFSLDDIVNLLQQELDDARKEHDRLSGLLERHVGDDDTYILEDYVDDLQEYIDELEDLSDTFDRLTDVRSRLDGDIELLRSNFKQLGLS